MPRKDTVITSQLCPRRKTKYVLSVDSLSRVHDQHDRIFHMHSTSELPSVDNTYSNLETCTHIVAALPIVERTGDAYIRRTPVPGIPSVTRTMMTPAS